MLRVRLSQLKRGFGILEMLMALLLLSVSIMTTFYLFPAGAQSLSLSRGTQLASHLCRQQLETYVQQPYASVSASASMMPTFTGTPVVMNMFVNGGYESATYTPMIVMSLTPSPASSVTPMIQVQSVVYWITNGKTRHSVIMQTTVAP